MYLKKLRTECLKITQNVAYALDIFNELLGTQNVNVARFARNVECDFLSDFQTLWARAEMKGKNGLFSLHLGTFWMQKPKK